MPSKNDLFTQGLWEDVKKELKGKSLDWWKDHREQLTGVAQEEAIDMLRTLKHNGSLEARLALLRQLSPEELKRVREHTLAGLQGMALRRVKLAEALLDLTDSAIKTLVSGASRVFHI